MPLLEKMTVPRKMALRERLRNDLGKRSAAESPAALLEYVERGRWQSARHLEYINDRLLALEKREITRLIVCVPPRCGKSTLVSKGFPSWWIGKHPDDRVMLASYEADFAASWGGKARDTMEEYGQEVFGIKVSHDSWSKSRWDIEGRPGGMTTAGVGGPFTGRGANLLIIEDPIKNDKQALSEDFRESLWEWMRSTAFSRLEPGAVVVIVMARWHADDPVGRIMDPERGMVNDWEIVNLPAFAGGDDPLGRASGEPLWPERFGREEWESTRRVLGSYWWEALYQQAPQVESGTTFKRRTFRYAERLDGTYVLHTGEASVLVPVDKCVTFQTVDLAVSEKDTADYTVVETWAATPDKDLILLDVFRDRVEGADHMAIITQQRAKHDAAQVGIEGTQYQLSLVQQAVRAGLPAVKLDADRNKLARALSMAARYEAGAVYHMRGSWLDEYEAELVSFPRGTHDDQVDAAAYAARHVMDLRRWRIG